MLTQFLGSLRVCPICSSDLKFRSKDSVLCAGCLEKLKTCRPHRSLKPYPFLALYEWPRNHLLRHLVYSLKRCQSESVFVSLAQAFIDQHFLFISEFFRDFTEGGKRPALLCPAPAKKGKQKDHAYLWAKAFERLGYGTLFCGLERMSVKPQKELPRNLRKQITMRLSATAYDLPPGPIVFLDDVHATGATARAAFHALQKPTQFAVWVLFSRERQVENTSHF